MDKTVVTGSNTRECLRKTLLEYIKNVKVKGLKSSMAQNRTSLYWALNPKNRGGCDNEVVQSLDMRTMYLNCRVRK